MCDARLSHLALLVHKKDDGVGHLFFVGAKGTDEVAQSFGKHRHGAIDEINRRGTMVGFLVNDASFFHIVAHVSNVYAHFPESVIYLANGERVVKVLCILGVDGESEHVAEVLTLSDSFGGNIGHNLIGSLLHILRIGVRQTIFGQNGVHLGRVFSGTPQNVDYLSDGILGCFRPLDYFHHHLVAILGILQLFFRNKYIISQRTAFGEQEGIVLVDLQFANKRVIGTFQDFDDFAFAFTVLASCEKSHSHDVVVHGMSRVTFSHKNGRAAIVWQQGILAIAFALKRPCHNLVRILQLKISFLRFTEEIILHHFMKNICAEHLQRMCIQFQI